MRMLFNTFAIAALAVVATASIPQTASAERVCRQECVGPVCTEKCVETVDRDRERVIIEGRGDRREERREERRDPGVEVKVPGVGVEIGR